MRENKAIRCRCKRSQKCHHVRRFRIWSWIFDRYY
jgi:hypothetical protein